MATYIGPLVLVLLGLGGLLFLFRWRVRAGAPVDAAADAALPFDNPGERGSARSGRFSALGGAVKRMGGFLRTLGRNGRAFLRVTGNVLRLLLRRPLARVPRISTRSSFPLAGSLARPAPLPVSDSVRAPHASESVARPRREDPDELFEFPDDLGPAQREISIPKSWASTPLPSAKTDTREKDVMTEHDTPALSEDVETISPLPSMSLDKLPAPEQSNVVEAESAPSLSPPEVVPFEESSVADGEHMPGDTGPIEQEVATAPTPSVEEKPMLTLEPHVRERAVGRHKIVGRVRTSQKKESPRVRKREASSPVVRKNTPAPPIAGEEGIEHIPMLLGKGHLARAEDILTQYLSTSPNDLSAYRWLAMVHVQRGEYAQAKEVCEEALRRNPDEGALYGPLGRAYVGLGQYSKALHMYQRAHESDETNLEYLEQLLLLASRMDHRALMRVTADKILLLQADHPLAKKSLERARATA